MTAGFEQPDGATPLKLEELRGLKPAWITSRRDLDEAEEANILRGLAWTQRARGDGLSEEFVLRLHKQMFGDVWQWAGTIRHRETNIGTLPHQIRPALRELLDTARWWREQRPFPIDEIAVRLHHRLMQIHPFPNGNGRHTRLMADLLVEELGGDPFTWGRQNLVAAGPLRASYISALKQADDGDIAALLAFARS
ncbi:MAG TPA: mobile mystery protein B [Roseateles sp.]|uniref:mobile mystery protein B n=1 Tax=Roseateles sp. TaxID=1971397 RepID=UPI002ED7CF6B